MGVVMTMTGVKAIVAECAKLTDINAHNDAALLLAQNFGNDSELTIIAQIKTQAEARGHGDNLHIMCRDYVVNKIIDRQQLDVSLLLKQAF